MENIINDLLIEIDEHGFIGTSFSTPQERRKAINEALNLGLIQPHGNRGHSYRLSEKGQNIVNSGESYGQHKIKEEETKSLEYDKLRLDVANAKRDNKFSLGLSVIAIILSLLSLILK